jgi:hypothetical protein
MNAILIKGNPIEGYTFMGPMSISKAQATYDYLAEKGGLIDDMCVAPLEEPIEIPVPVSELDPEELPF